MEIWQAINKEQLKRDFQRVFDKGIRSLAVVLMHAYTYVYTNVKIMVRSYYRHVIQCLHFAGLGITKKKLDVWR